VEFSHGPPRSAILRGHPSGVQSAVLEGKAGACDQVPHRAGDEHFPRASAILMSDLVRDRIERLTSGSGTVSRPEVSRDGSRVGFSSDAPDETDDDPDGGTDVFVVDLEGDSPPGDRVVLRAPANGIQLPLAAPTSVTFRWTALGLPGLTQYALEITGVNRAFANPNGTEPDATNGFGGAGLALLSPGTRTTLDVIIPPGVAPGNYQVRVVGLTATFQPVGRFRDAITLVLGVVPIPPDAQPTITTPAPNSPLALGGPVQIVWSVVPGRPVPPGSQRPGAAVREPQRHQSGSRRAGQLRDPRHGGVRHSPGNAPPGHVPDASDQPQRDRPAGGDLQRCRDGRHPVARAPRPGLIPCPSPRAPPNRAKGVSRP
jgi:hypothetical protein